MAALSSRTKAVDRLIDTNERRKSAEKKSSALLVIPVIFFVVGLLRVDSIFSSILSLMLLPIHVVALSSLVFVVGLVGFLVSPTLEAQEYPYAPASGFLQITCRLLPALVQACTSIKS
ncbi:hypothetical protein DFH07DRAFT_34873 [Mycena maculata]|uniref:Uncharacterized protein n=1 Tax=Mycena maculata TaxID=230809 RepID=A0AAD7IKM5_9AGAR|nr:hypothetical protein DFH07DRAFT_34873 [Mycena maculata]